MGVGPVVAFPPALVVRADAAVAALRRRGWTVTVAESCTGGLLAGLLTSAPGASDVFGRGWVVYANDAKRAELGVLPALFAEHGAVSAEVAAAMAEGARVRAAADVAVAITGIAGPGGGTPEKPAGLVFVARAGKTPAVQRFRFADAGRDAVRGAAVEAGLAMIEEVL